MFYEANLLLALFSMDRSLIGNAFSEVPIEKLNVPSTFAPTFQCCDATCESSWPNDCYGQEDPVRSRPWFVDLGKIRLMPLLSILRFLLQCTMLMNFNSLREYSFAGNLNGKTWVPVRFVLVLLSFQYVGDPLLNLHVHQQQIMAAGPALLALVLVFLDDG